MRNPHVSPASPALPWSPPLRARTGLGRRALLLRSAALGLAFAGLLAAAGCGSAPPESRAPARLALVIGNADYANARPLANPVHDAEDMCQALRGLGFVTVCRTNLRTRDEFAALVDAHVARLGPDTVGLVYYAGHAVQVGGANFLLPTQGRPAGGGTSPLSALFGVEDLFDRLGERPARLNIVMLDACRTELFADGPAAPSGRGAAAAATPAAAPTRSALLRDLKALPGSATGLAPIRDAPPRTVVFYATAAKSAAFDGDGRNGPLTKHILANIGTRDQFLETFFKRVTEGVETETLRDFAKRQSPFTYGSFAGRFCFNGCPGDLPDPPPAL